MKATLKIKTNNTTTVLEYSFNAIKEAVAMANHHFNFPFSSPATANFERYDIYVNRVDNGACKFWKFVIKK